LLGWVGVGIGKGRLQSGGIGGVKGRWHDAIF
jgi:hypothetical protein